MLKISQNLTKIKIHPKTIKKLPVISIKQEEQRKEKNIIKMKKMMIIMKLRTLMKVMMKTLKIVMKVIQEAIRTKRNKN